MAYSEFAYLYDDLNAAANYDALCDALTAALKRHGITNGIVADLGCGTGEVSLRLAKAGYDMLCVDGSEDMLTVFREKLMEQEIAGPLLLQQDLAHLDLYGTICAAVSTFDTLNHLEEHALRRAVERVALFMEPGGLFLFDVNTPYKHRHILGDNEFLFEEDGFCLRWQNHYLPDEQATHITLQATEGGEELFNESFYEYSYSQAFWSELLTACGFSVEQVLDGESFGLLTGTSQRFLFCAKKHI